jgi:hypothetical protein
VAVVFGFAYSLVNSLFLLAGLAIIVSSKWLVGFVYSSSEPLLLLGFPWLLRKASACCLEEVPGSVLGATSFATASWTWGPADWFWKPWVCCMTDQNSVFRRIWGETPSFAIYSNLKRPMELSKQLLTLVEKTQKNYLLKELWQLPLKMSYPPENGENKYCRHRVDTSHCDTSHCARPVSQYPSAISWGLPLKFGWCETTFQECEQHLNGVRKIMQVWSQK